MASFFEAGTVSSIDQGTVQAVVTARNEAVSARDDALAAQSVASSASSTAQQSAANAQTSAAAAASAVTAIGTSVSSAQSSATAAAASATAAASSASDAADASANALAASTSADTSSDLAQQWASELPGVDVTPGLQSARSYALVAQSTAASAVAMPAKNLLDADFSGGNYTLLKADLGFLLRAKNTTAGTILLSPGLWTGPGPTSGPSSAPVRVVKRGAGSVAFGSASSAVVSPTRLVDQLYQYSSTTIPATLTGSHSLVVPSGTKRKLVLMLMSLHETTSAGRTIGMSVTGTGVSGLTKTLAETSDGYVITNNLLQVQWTADIADGGQVTLTIAPTLDNPDSYAVWAFVAGGVNSTIGSAGGEGVGSATTGVADQTQTLTPSEAKDMLVFGLGMISANSLPVTIGGGITPTQSQNGKTPGTRTSRDFSYIFGYEVVPNTTAESYTLTSGLSSHGGHQGIVLRPGTASSVTINGSPGTMSTVGQMADILADDDGVTYDVRVF